MSICVEYSNNKVINLKKKDDEIVSYFIGINIRVIMVSRKTNVKEKVINLTYCHIPNHLSGLS